MAFADLYNIYWIVHTKGQLKQQTIPIRKREKKKKQGDD